MIKFKEIEVENPGILIADLPNEIWEVFEKSMRKQIAEKNIFASLKEAKHPEVGGIYESINVSLPIEFTDFAKKFATEYYSYFNMSPPKKISILSSWLNLQKKYEFRPYHRHTFASDNTHLSFVVWLQIPYSLENEDKYPNHSHAKTFRNSRFEFMINTLSGDVACLPLNVDKSYQGKMMIFPNGLMHTVYPFYTSDDYRISLAGNFMVE